MCDNLDMYELAPDGSYAKGPLLDTTVTERFVRPKDCQPPRRGRRSRGLPVAAALRRVATTAWKGR